jgi:hypothetical protein
VCTMPDTNCHRFVTSRTKAWQLSPVPFRRACYNKSRLMV